MPINSEHLASLTDADVIDQNGDKVGGVGQIYLDDATGQPAWVSVKSGLFGLRESFVPLSGADVAGGNIRVPYTKDFIKDAPRVDAENHLDDSQQSTLYSYYGAERPTAAGGESTGEADPTATFGSEQTAEDLYDARSESEPARVTSSDQEGELTTDYQEGAVTSEYTTPGGSDEMSAPGAGMGAATGGLPRSDEAAAPDSAPVAGGSDPAAGLPATDTAAGAEPVGSDAGAGTTPGGQHTPSPRDPDWDETQHATYQQENPAAQEDWSAEEAPEEPVSTTWSVPPSDPADEEPTRVARSGYASDRPAAHSSAYEGHHATTAPAGEGVAAGAEGEPVIDQTVEEEAVYTADADAAAGDADAFGTVEPVGSEAPPEPGSTAGEYSPYENVEPTAGAGTATDDAVTGAPGQTGTGYPEDVEEDSGAGLGGAALGGAVAGGAVAGGAAAGYAASETGTTAYEVPGAETGSPITDAEPGAELAADREVPYDAGTAPADETLEAGADTGDAPSDATLESGTDTGDGDGEPEAFGAQGYRPDRDGTEMTDEERERLNQARGAL
ncbi:PRC-barrel domain-containing protein [Ornithinimicrobium cavernae]|uniref:PRC-barrel domain-containing protein n=1 Tax=Ornithinimicrobium cavernae TaxID=2666047 RepID=UPI001F3FF67D|nr:PRC-barrel domain-containing protein [Ornithinimicrobium cavernae]